VSGRSCEGSDVDHASAQHAPANRHDLTMPNWVNEEMVPLTVIE
jgi:hypothetical protein